MKRISKNVPGDGWGAENVNTYCNNKNSIPAKSNYESCLNLLSHIRTIIYTYLNIKHVRKAI